MINGKPYLRLRFLITLAVLASSLSAQDVTIINARIIGPNASVIERGSIVVRGGKIVQMDVWNDSAERLLTRNGIDA